MFVSEKTELRNNYKATFLRGQNALDKRVDQFPTKMELDVKSNVWPSSVKNMARLVVKSRRHRFVSLRLQVVFFTEGF